MNRAFLFGFTAILLLAACSQERDQGQRPDTDDSGTSIITGQVTDTDGAGVAGAWVTATESSGVRHTVFSDGAGAFTLPISADGAVTLLAHTTGRTSTAAPVKEGGPYRLTVQPKQDPLAHLPSAWWLALLPDSDRRKEFIVNCASCHEISAARVIQDGVVRDKARWMDALALMRGIDEYSLIPPDFIDQDYAGWLAGHLTAETIATLPQERPVDAAAVTGAVITEYDLPMEGSLPHDLVVGPDGRIWITAFFYDKIWAFDPETGAYDSFDVNDSSETWGQVRALEFDTAGMLWIVLGGTQSLVKLDPATGTTETYPVGMYPHSLDIDAHGDIWVNDYFSKPERIGRLRTATGKVDIFNVASANLPVEEGLPLPYGLQIDPQGRVWSTQLAANTLVAHDIASGESRLITLPVANSGPRRPAIAPDGALWTPEFNTGFIARTDPETLEITRFDLGLATSGPYDIEIDQRTGRVWVTGSLSSSLIAVDPDTGQAVDYPFPTEPAYTRHIAIDPGNGDVWTAYSSLPAVTPKLVRLRVP